MKRSVDNHIFRASIFRFGAVLCLTLFFFSFQAKADQSEDQRHARARASLLEAIETDVAATSSHIGFDHLDPAVLKAMAAVRRQRFVPAKYAGQAFNNHPLPIGYGQTISQPYIVALMSNLLGVRPGDRVLEVGTGSGYQAAVLAQMGAAVFSIEIIRSPWPCRFLRPAGPEQRPGPGDGMVAALWRAPYSALF